jgi:hypothetical protein
MSVFQILFLVFERDPLDATMASRNGVEVGCIRLEGHSPFLLSRNPRFSSTSSLSFQVDPGGLSLATCNHHYDILPFPLIEEDFIAK